MKRSFILIVVLLVAAWAAGQTTGAIEGAVADPGRQPLPGVTLELTSPALQGARVVQTNVNGQFHAQLLPPGEYRLTASLAGFATLEQTGIMVGLSRTVTLQITLQEAFQETVTITGESPVVDVTSTTTGSNFAQEMITDLPTGRSYQSLAFMTAGALPGGILNNPAVMGSSSAENRYIVDGMDTTDPAFGTAGTNVTFDFVQEVEVKTGGYEAEYGGALGGIVNVITKSGSNEYHGDVFGYFTDDSLTEEGEEVTAPRAASLAGFTTYDYGLDMGGRILRDKVWYFVALNPSFQSQDQYINMEDRATGELRQTNTYEPQTDFLYAAGKLSWQVSPSHSLIATVVGDPSENSAQLYHPFNVGPPNTGTDPATGLPAETDQEYVDDVFGSWNTGLTLNSILSPNLLLELKVARHDAYQEFISRYDSISWEDGTGAGDFSNGVGNRVWIGGPGFQQVNADRSRDQIKAALSWFAGPHEIKAGMQYYKLDYTDIATVSGPSGEHCVPLAPGAYTFDPVTGTYPELVPDCDTDGDGTLDGLLIPAVPGNRYRLRDGYYYNSNYKDYSKGTTTEYALFVQDSWKVTPSLTLNLGLRADAAELKGDISDSMDNRTIELGLGEQVAPRLGFIWDPANTGRSKVYGHWGRFYESIPLDINVRAFGNEDYDFIYYYYPDNGDLPSPDNAGQLFYYLYGGGGTFADPDLKGQFLDEFVAGGDFEVLPNLALGVKGIYRELGEVIEDVSVTRGNTYFVTNPGGCLDHDPVTGAAIDLDGDGVTDTVCFPTPERTYQGAELTLNRRFYKGWQLAASLLWSRSEGNLTGLFRQETAQLDPNLTSAYDLPSMLVNATGLLPSDRTWQFRSFGSYRFDFGLTVGFNAQWMTGTPISKLGSHMLYGDQERFVTERGSEGRTPDLWWADLHLDYPLKLGGLEVSAILDVFNLTNQQKAIYVDEEWTTMDKGYEDPDDPFDWVDPNEADPSYWNNLSGSACDFWTQPEVQDQYEDWELRYEYCNGWNPGWGQPTQYQNPRSIRLGFKISW